MKDKNDTPQASGFASEDDKVRARLIEAAGRVFAEQGYEKALGKDIAELANTNPASINYYFGGKEKLYMAVINKAHEKLPKVDQIRALRMAGKNPTQTFRMLINLIVGGLVASGSNEWAIRVFMRELANPSSVMDSVFMTEMIPKVAELSQIIGAVAELPPDHPTTRRCLMSLAAHVSFILQNRFMILKVMPDAFKEPNAVEILTDHIYEFCVAGIKAVSRKTKLEEKKS